MSVSIVDGDLLEAKEDIIAHQVNCKGVMGSGVAKQIKEKWPQAYEAYAFECAEVYYDPDLLLGEVVYCDAIGRNGKKTGIEIAHMFGQDGYGREKKPYTIYRELRCAMENVADYANYSGKSVAMPYKIGCGLGGGDWDGVVLPMIHDIFDPLNVEVKLYRKR